MKSYGVTAAMFHFNFPRTISSQSYEKEMTERLNYIKKGKELKNHLIEKSA